MPNIFDQFDAAALRQNPFDQFDAPQTPPAPQPEWTGGPQRPGIDTPLNPDGTLAETPNPAPAQDPYRGLKIGAQAVGSGAAHLAGAPFDLTNLLANIGLSGADLLSGAVGGPDINYRVPGSVGDTIKNTVGSAVESTGIDLIGSEEMTPRERGVYNVEDFATQALLGGGLLGAAPKTTGVPVLSKLQEPYQRSAAPLISDTAGGAGAGVGHSAYETYAPDWLKESFAGPLLDTAATVFGGGAGASTAAGVGGLGDAVKNAGRNMVGPDKNAPVNPKTNRPFSRNEMDIAATRTQKSASNPSLAASEISDKVADLSQFGPRQSLPTTGLLSDDVGLAMAENRARPKDNVPFIERDQRVRTQARDLVDQSAPAGADGRTFTDTARRAADAPVAAARRGVEQAQGRQRGVTEARQAEAEAQVGQYGGRGGQASERLDEQIVDQTMLPMTEASSRMYNTADPNRAAMVPADTLVDAATAVRQTLGDLNQPNRVIPQGLLARIEGRVDPESGDVAPVAVGDIVQVFPEIAKTSARARQAENFQLVDNLRTLRGEMTAILRTAADNGDEAAARALAADQNYADTVGTTFGRGESGEPRKFRQKVNLDRQGRSASPPSQTASRFLKPGQPERARDLQAIIDRSPNPADGQAAVQEFLLSDMASSGVLDRASGTIRPDRLRLWTERWGDTLDVAPGFRATLNDTLRRAQRGEEMSTQMTGNLRQAERRLTDAEKNKGAMGLVLDKNPVNAVAAVFQSGDPERAMSEIISKIGRGGNRRDALDGLKAATRDYLVERDTMDASQNTVPGTGDPLSFSRLNKLFKQHENVLSQIYSPEEMRSLRAAHKFLEPLKNKELGATTGSQTHERGSDSFWRMTEIALKAKFGILKGGGVLRTMRLWAQTLPSNTEAVAALQQQMWFDPDLAQHLLMRPVADVNTPQWNSKLNTLLGVAEGQREANK